RGGRAAGGAAAPGPPPPALTCVNAVQRALRAGTAAEAVRVVWLTESIIHMPSSEDRSWRNRESGSG
ncbi:hypothetical protein ACFV0W_31220, partial [Streptomyces anulatus]